MATAMVGIRLGCSINVKSIYETGCLFFLTANLFQRKFHSKSCSHVVQTATKSNPSPATKQQCKFGLLFDIDGVIVRGRNVLPHSVEAFQKLVDINGNFRVPTIFVTNAGNTMRHQKAQQLSDWLGVQINEQQVVMSHSPLRMFRQFHEKHCLISGQGPIVEIAKGLGFTKVTTVDQLRNCFPTLDAVDHKRRIHVPCAFERYFPRIEAVVLFGEPVRWETSLQLILDVLMSNGLPCESLPIAPYPHLPVLACNMDLQWMAEACTARFGHGAFLVCLENLYKKITGKDVIYTALVGKPSEITYLHAEHCLLQEARKIGITSPIKSLYAIGDNINTDIFGANLYNHYIQKRTKQKRKEKAEVLAHVKVTAGRSRETDLSRMGIIPEADFNLEVEEGVISCKSVLVHTGVYNQDFDEGDFDHSPRDFLPAEAALKEPTYKVEDVLSAVNLIFNEENFS
ncbi:haloacid dehalogenase-like hydrolase domain-containing 5 [Limulus polyphemus]|uniref:Haloacid dehalogenase-like hydrolase domain-containing 5 n=1 Tax=Limulus polyphemus TaxID=6850 RepID=A0ABM1SZK4_LIMPO|nr:haloacid dehalogenase-like hydrolase domain-containing 5 [Limulus polyphemus]